MSEESDLPDWPHLGAVMKGKKVPQKTTKQWKKAKYNQCMACNWWCKLSPRYSAARWHVCPLLSVKLAWKLVKFPSTSVSHLFIGQCLIHFLYVVSLFTMMTTTVSFCFVDIAPLFQRTQALTHLWPRYWQRILMEMESHIKFPQETRKGILSSTTRKVRHVGFNLSLILFFFF